MKSNSLKINFNQNRIDIFIVINVNLKLCNSKNTLYIFLRTNLTITTI